MVHQIGTALRERRAVFCCGVPGRCELMVHHRGREQLVPAVPRPGRQKRPCGAFLERGRVPGERSCQQYAAGVEPYGNVGLIFLYHVPGKQAFVHHRGREQLVPAVPCPGRQKRPCGAFLERGRVPGERSDQQHGAPFNANPNVLLFEGAFGFVFYLQSMNMK